MENLLVSWREFLRGKKKRKDVIEFALHFNDNLFSLHEDLKAKIYRPGGYQAFKINDPKPRDIHKASVRDRLVHHAIYRILYPYFDNKFIHDSYSCRNKKGTHRAINRFNDFARKVSKNNMRTAWVLKCDIRKFFASIDHKTLKDILSRHIGDKDGLWLLSQIIDSFTLTNVISDFPIVIPGERQRGKGIKKKYSSKRKLFMDPRLHEDDSLNNKTERVGLPLGNLTSQLLVNIYMNEFDHFVKRELKVKYYIRYADDFVVFSEDKNYLEELVLKISDFLQSMLKLSLHPDKLHIKTIDSGLDFLGWINFPHHKALRTSTKRRMMKNLDNTDVETRQGVSTVRSYSGLLKYGDTYDLQRRIFSGFPPPRE